MTGPDERFSGCFGATPVTTNMDKIVLEIIEGGGGRRSCCVAMTPKKAWQIAHLLSQAAAEVRKAYPATPSMVRGIEAEP
jgi:hypothetical protein